MSGVSSESTGTRFRDNERAVLDISLPRVEADRFQAPLAASGTVKPDRERVTTVSGSEAEIL